ncbi:hypothetical protein M0R45_033215 [Rubus argutus]|uniref:Protein kinase domain-containing protein n=1 Tax=Rubus argutus TaxID=59490 RepID=A0AAW1WMK6_RUBAR
MKPLLTHPLYLSLFLYYFVTLLMASYTPIDDITLACGYSRDQAISNYNHQNWTGDINSKFPPIEDGNTNTPSQVRTLSTEGQVPFTAARLSHSEFTYRFPLSPGQKFIRLYFNPASYQDFDRSKSNFSVKAGGFTLLKDFNAYAVAKSDYTDTLIREFCVNIDPQQQSLNITFSPTREIPDAYAFINGIEIVSMPTNLYYTETESKGIPYLGNQVNYYIENSTALESMYRINVGGRLVSPEGDTGMYRTWNEDDPYLDDVSRRLSIKPLTSNPELNFSKIPEYTAPKEVYRTGRSMGGNNKTRKLSYNLTWGFHVDPDFFYLVRLHFCEFEIIITRSRDRVFLIYIANQTAETQADIIRWSGGNGVPMYRDYIVYMPSQGSKKKVNLFLALQANPNNWLSNYADALLNGLEIFKLNDTNGNLAGPNPDLPEVTAPEPGSQNPKNLNKKKLTAIVAGVAVTGILVLCVLGYLVFKRGRKVKDSSSCQKTKWGPFSFATTKSTKSRGLSLPSDLCHHFSLAEIKEATENFNDIFIIGVGGFGNVYKGYVDGGSTPVAIKRLKPESSQGAHEFKTEIEMLSHLRHLHLVSLIGYCTEQGEMILVYDYMARGTLRDHLYNTENPPLPWEHRLQICIGAARGLQYLHTGAKCMVIHRDVKSTNILLDEKWTAKVSDFGLSKIGTTTMSRTHISTMVKGSFGYLDPEYYRRQQLTEKSDIYSFGVVLCEVLCARPALLRTVEKKQTSLAQWTKSCHRHGSINQIIDPNLRGKIVATCLDKYVELAVSCMNDNGNERPSMNDVVWGLEFALQLQQSENVCLDFNVEKKAEDDEAPLFMNGSDSGISCSWEGSSVFKNSRTTKSSSSTEQTSTTNKSIKGMSGTVFSEIKDPTGR